MTGRGVAASRRALGNVMLAVEDARDVWSLGLLDRLRQDLQAAWRVTGEPKEPVGRVADQEKLDYELL